LEFGLTVSNSFLRRERFLIGGWLSILAGLLVAGLHPFNFFPRNQVAWLTRENGVELGGYGEVYGSKVLEPVDRGRSEVEFSLELLVMSYEGTKPSIEKLVSVYRAQTEEHFAIERWTTNLVLAGWFRDASKEIVFRRLFCGPTLATNARRFITITRGPEGTTVYLEGVGHRTYPGLMLVSDNFDGRLLLGQTASTHQEWHGAVLGLAIYNKALMADEVAEDYYSWRRGDIEQLRRRAPDVRFIPSTKGRGRWSMTKGISAVPWRSQDD
jgi:hypothetical protein